MPGTSRDVRNKKRPAAKLDEAIPVDVAAASETVYFCWLKNRSPGGC